MLAECVPTAMSVPTGQRTVICFEPPRPLRSSSVAPSSASRASKPSPLGDHFNLAGSRLDPDGDGDGQVEALAVHMRTSPTI
jgi:hypothetical protein